MNLLNLIEVFELALVVVVSFVVRKRRGVQMPANKEEPATQRSRFGHVLSKTADSLQHVRVEAVANMVRSARSAHCSLSLAWLVVLAASVVVCAHFVSDSARQYFSMPVSTTVKFVNKQVVDRNNQSEQALQVTFCSSSPNVAEDNNKTTTTTTTTTPVLYCSPDQGQSRCAFDTFTGSPYGTCYRYLSSVAQRFRWPLHLTLSATHSNTSYAFFIEHPTARPVWTRPIELAPAFGYVLTVTKSAYEREPWPYSSCSVLDDNSKVLELADERFFNATTDRGNKYVRRVCVEMCKEFLDAGGGGLDNINFATYCFERCPLQCTQSVLNKKIYSYRHHRHLAVEIRVDFRDARFVLYQEEAAMSGEDLLGLVGGHLHVFLGMSLLSFVHLVELFAMFVLDTLLVAFHYLRRRNYPS